MRLQEISPNTVKGSWTSDLTLRKLWGLTELKKIKDRFDTVYILGSWYGNAAIILNLLRKQISFEHIVNVDTDQQALDTSERLLNKMGLAGNTEFMLADANELDYRQLGDNGLVLNFSTVDIAGTDWFENIPPGTTVLVQARDSVEGSPNQFSTVEDLIQRFPLSRVDYQGEKLFKDPETEFKSFMIIGQK